MRGLLLEGREMLGKIIKNDDLCPKMQKTQILSKNSINYSKLLKIIKNSKKMINYG